MATSDIAGSLLVLSGICVCIILLLYVITARSKYRFQCKSLKQYELILMLVRNIQQHRGLSLGLISGEQALEEKVMDAQRKVAYTIDDLSRLLGNRVSKRWDGFLDHWGRLSRNVKNLELEDNFQQHNHMISNLLYLAENICNNSDLGYGPNRAKAQDFWRQLLVLSECIGQSRALGTAALARQKITYLESIRFQLLSEKIDDRLHAMDQSIDPFKMRELETAIRPVHEALRQFMADIRLYPHSSQEYFSIASTSLDQVSSVLDQELLKMKQALQVDESHVKARSTKRLAHS